ncbi:MAG: hypothetical protein KIT14_18160 [bacterium]|nr:hypothetical protein [bacterium]
MSRARLAAVAWAALLAVAMTCWVLALPRRLGDADEAQLLYESRRLLDGAVLYRDVYEITPPGSLWLFAAGFGLFGTSMLVARALSGVVQGVLVALVWLTARQAGVPPGLATALGLVHATLLYPVWPYASPHWLGTIILLALLAVELRSARRGGGFLAAGLVCGSMFWMQHQRGVVLAIGATALVVLETLLLHPGPKLRTMTRAVARFAGGGLAATLPLAAWILLTSGFASPFDALILLPLTGYREYNQIGWGGGARHPMLVENAAATFPALLAWMPLLTVLELVRTMRALLRGDLPGARVAFRLAGVSMLAIGSVLYFPDFIHLAFVAPVFLVLLGDLMTRALVHRRVLRAGAPVAAAALMATALVCGGLYWRRTWTRAYPYESAFGLVHLARPMQGRGLDALRAWLREQNARETFVYPYGASIYLLTGTTNPTPFQILHPTYSAPRHFGRALIDLAEHGDPPLLVVFNHARPEDPLVAATAGSYRRVVDDTVTQNLGLYIYERRPD